MYRQVDILAFLAKIVQRNTQHYQSDFEKDRALVQAAAQKEATEDKRFCWMSRPNGTWCLNEREVFLQETNAHRIWTYYEGEASHIKAYRLVITGQCQGAPIGDIYPLNYAEHVCRVKKNALQTSIVTLTFESGEVLVLPYDSVKGKFQHLIIEHGAIQCMRFSPESESELNRVMEMEHRYEKYLPRNKRKGKIPPLTK